MYYFIIVVVVVILSSFCAASVESWTNFLELCANQKIDEYNTYQPNKQTLHPIKKKRMSLIQEKMGVSTPSCRMVIPFVADEKNLVSSTHFEAYTQLTHINHCLRFPLYTRFFQKYIFPMIFFICLRYLILLFAFWRFNFLVRFFFSFIYFLHE